MREYRVLNAGGKCYLQKRWVGFGFVGRWKTHGHFTHMNVGRLDAVYASPKDAVAANRDQFKAGQQIPVVERQYITV